MYQSTVKGKIKGHLRWNPQELPVTLLFLRLLLRVRRIYHLLYLYRLKLLHRHVPFFCQLVRLPLQYKQQQVWLRLLIRVDSARWSKEYESGIDRKGL